MDYSYINFVIKLRNFVTCNTVDWLQYDLNNQANMLKLKQFCAQSSENDICGMMLFYTIIHFQLFTTLLVF